MYIWIYEIKNALYIMHIEISVRFKEFLIYVHCAQMHMLKILTVYTEQYSYTRTVLETLKNKSYVHATKVKSITYL